MASEQKIQYVRLGKSGLKVSRIILGCMSYGDQTVLPWCLDERTGIEHIRYAYEQGVNTFDTANTYSAGASEVILGKALKEIGAPRESFVVLTKCFNAVGEAKVNQHGLSRKHIFDAVHASLERLQLDYVDVLQCHRFDYETPIEETMQALHDVIQAGLRALGRRIEALHLIGKGNPVLGMILASHSHVCWAYQFHAMQNYAISNGLTPFISMQNFHNAAYREEEREMIPTLKMFGVGCIPWSPLARGFLTRPWRAAATKRQETDAGYKSRGLAEPHKSQQILNERVEEIAKKKGVSMAQLALAWSLANEFITAPIVGTTNLDSLKELITATDIKLSAEEKNYIDEVYEQLPVRGHN